MDKVRIGVIGLGAIGGRHAAYINSVDGAALAALCDADAPRLKKLGQQYGVQTFNTYPELIDSGAVDAILIATPHFSHSEIARHAFAAGLHVLCEKPLSVTIKEGRRMVDEYNRHPHLKFALMFQQRTWAMYATLRKYIAEGELGEITRVTWLITDWFRTWSYYASGGWRATWAEEGGGVLINQCPHNLDLMQWCVGMMPSKVTAVACIGKTHPIEVEDEVSAILEYPNGAIGHFMTSTGEAPGTNRLEICGDRGKIVAENWKLHFSRTRKSVREMRETSPLRNGGLETWEIEIPTPPGPNEGHKTITQNFVNAILKNEPLFATGADGLNGLELGNAILMAGLTRTPVNLPIDADEYEEFLAGLTKKYGGTKQLHPLTEKFAAAKSRPLPA